MKTENKDQEKENNQEQKEENQNEIMGIENVNQDDSEEENKEENTVEFIDEKEKRYKAQIEQLSSELEIEKKLNQSIKRKPEEEEIIETLKSKLNERRFKFNKLKTTNERQSQAIEQLTRELENSYKKKNRDKNVDLTTELMCFERKGSLYQILDLFRYDKNFCFEYKLE